MSFPATSFPAPSFPATSVPATSFPAASLQAASLPAASLQAASLPATSLPAGIAPAVLDTILRRLAALFVIATSPAAARQAASQTLAAYNVADEQELGLAADIIAFALHALEALGQAANPDLSLAKILRLRGSAVSLSRESHKARRKLDQLQRARRAAANRPATEPQSKSIGPRHETRATATPALKPGIAAAPPQEPLPPGAPQPDARLPDAPVQGALLPAALPPAAELPGATPVKPEAMTWTQSYRKRQTEKRLARKALKAQAAQAREAMQARQAARHNANPHQSAPAASA